MSTLHLLYDMCPLLFFVDRVAQASLPSEEWAQKQSEEEREHAEPWLHFVNDSDQWIDQLARWPGFGSLCQTTFVQPRNFWKQTPKMDTKKSNRSVDTELKAIQWGSPPYFAQLMCVFTRLHGEYTVVKTSNHQCPFIIQSYGKWSCFNHMELSWNRSTPKSSILIGISLKNSTIFGYPHLWNFRNTSAKCGHSMLDGQVK